MPLIRTGAVQRFTYAFCLTLMQVTPFLLERIRALTQGKSLESNIKLVKNNAQIGAQVAVCLARITGATRSKM